GGLVDLIINHLSQQSPHGGWARAARPVQVPALEGRIRGAAVQRDQFKISPEFEFFEALGPKVKAAKVESVLTAAQPINHLIQLTGGRPRAGQKSASDEARLEKCPS